MKKFGLQCLLLAAFVFAAFAQVTTGRLEGTVTDPQGAAVPGATVKVANTQTGQNFSIVTDDKGLWTLPSLATALYSVSVSHPGFKTATIENVKIDAGVPATANIRLEVGSLAETVEVSGGADVLQTQSATVTSTLVGRQLHELPFTSRNLTELIVTQPGSATPGVPRSTSVYGLPQSALNVTLDGINIQDNSNKSSDGFFNAIFPRADSIEEMTVTSAAAGADSNAEGAMQVKMVTRSGSNTWHGGLFEQHRNQSLNANSYFNNLNGTAPRDHLVFNQFGGTGRRPHQAKQALLLYPRRSLPASPNLYRAHRPGAHARSHQRNLPLSRYRGRRALREPLPARRRQRFPLHPRPASSCRASRPIASLTNGVAGPEEPHRHQCRLQPQQPGFPE